MAKKKIVAEATHEDEKQLMSVVSNEATEVKVRGKVFKVRWMHPGTIDWITSLMLKDGNDSKVVCQCAALIILNGFWSCHLWYWFVWRWMYYIKQYTSAELMPVIEEAQKKTQQLALPAYLNATIYLTVLKNTKKMMTKEEAERSLRELTTASDGKSPRSTNG